MKAEILKDEGFIKNCTIVDEGTKKYLRLYLKYLKGNKSAIKNLKRISKPGLRRYVDVEKIPRVLNGLGIVVMSTSKGLVTGENAKKENVGGEVICTVW